MFVYVSFSACIYKYIEIIIIYDLEKAYNKNIIFLREAFFIV